MKKEKDRALLASCAEHHLYKEIEELQPNLLVLMGTFACHAIDPDITLELHHGIPVQTRMGITAFPMYHPAGAMYESKKMLQIRNDWIRLRRYLRGTLDIPADQFPSPDYKEATAADIRDIDPTLQMAQDTEWSRSKGPYFITWTQEPGKARLIPAKDKDKLKLLQKKLDKWESYIYYHNWPYDWNQVEDMGLQYPTKLSVAEQMGLEFPFPMTRDTMMMCFHLGNVPQGLKVLAYRLLGMEMQDFSDLVQPWSTKRVLEYYRLAQTFEWKRPEEQLIIDDKTGKWKLYRPQSVATKLKTFFTAYNKNPEGKEVFGMFEDKWQDHQQEIIERCGPFFGLDIFDVPFSDALFYACRDSDALIRVVPVLLKMREQANSGKLQELWDL